MAPGKKRSRLSRKSRKRPTAPPKGRGGHPLDTSLLVEEVRLAVLHLVELAAAFEGRGLQLDEAVEALDDDVRVLREVTDALLRHRREQCVRRRDAWLPPLSRGLEEAYRAFRRDDSRTAFELQEVILRGLEAVGITPSETELDVLVMERDLETADNMEDGTEQSISIGTVGGPAAAAKEALSETAGRSSRSIGYLRQPPSSWLPSLRKSAAMLPVRIAFHRWVPRRARAAYVIALHEEVLQHAREQRVRLGDLVKEDGGAVDLAVEGVVRAIATRLSSVRPLAQEVDEAASALQRTILDVIGPVRALTRVMDAGATVPELQKNIASIHAVVSKSVLNETRTWGDGGVQDATAALLQTVFEDEDDSTPELTRRAEEALADAIRSQVQREARERFDAVFGELDEVPLSDEARAALMELMT